MDWLIHTGDSPLERPPRRFYERMTAKCRMLPLILPWYAPQRGLLGGAGEFGQHAGEVRARSSPFRGRRSRMLGRCCFELW